MENKRPYCMNCDEERDYEIQEVEEELTVKDSTFTLKILKAFCKVCGEQVFPYEVGKQNDILIFDEYRRRKGLLTSKQIKDIRKKRGMSQTQLAEFINAGEKTIARYETGTIQDAIFDLLIRMVGDDSCYKAMKDLKTVIKNQQTSNVGSTSI